MPGTGTYRIGDIVMVSGSNTKWDGQVCKIIDYVRYPLSRDKFPDIVGSSVYRLKDVETGKVRNFPSGKLVPQGSFDTDQTANLICVKDGPTFGLPVSLPFNQLVKSTRGAYISRYGNRARYVLADDPKSLYDEADIITKGNLKRAVGSKVRARIKREFPDITIPSIEYSLLADSLTGGLDA